MRRYLVIHVTLYSNTTYVCRTFLETRYADETSCRGKGTKKDEVLYPFLKGLYRKEIDILNNSMARPSTLVCIASST
jgi:hypothetical protein